MILAVFIKTLIMILNAYSWVIIIGALISFVNPDPYNKIVQLIRIITRPAYKIVQATRIPTNFGGIDISPIIIILALNFIIILLTEILVRV